MQRVNPLKSGDHSEVVPLLPIPNRTVKHLSADDSADYLCESRSLPDTPISSKDVVNKPPYSKEAGVLLCAEEMQRVDDFNVEVYVLLLPLYLGF